MKTGHRVGQKRQVPKKLQSISIWLIIDSEQIAIKFEISDRMNKNPIHLEIWKYKKSFWDSEWHDHVYPWNVRKLPPLTFRVSVCSGPASRLTNRCCHLTHSSLWREGIFRANWRKLTFFGCLSCARYRSKYSFTALQHNSDTSVLVESSLYIRKPRFWELIKWSGRFIRKW